ncbi:uncharacterized protein LOC135401517 isoform X2 [Ornithodoros turicata]|uniref:uncharacterized protein LOC135401517 isoform X2 n=1 Tax=Ornithodoros turicata TaxID=34597 RepID=UPI003138C482
MYRISIWSGILLTVYVTIGSCVEVRLQKREADIYAKCLPALLEDVQHVATAVQITLIPPRFSPEKECVLKGEYAYMVSYAKEGEEPQRWIPPGTKGPIVLQNLKPSTAYRIKVAMSYHYTSTNQAKETPEFLIETKTTDIAVPPPPTTEIKLVDSSLLNKTQQRYEFPYNMFSNANGILEGVRILVAQDTEIDKCEQPVTWKEAHLHSPIKCYDAGDVDRFESDCLLKHPPTLTCVLGFQKEKECGNRICNGPLTPGVKYGVKLRGINDAGSTDSKPAFFTAGSPPGAAGSGSGVSGKGSDVGGKGSDVGGKGSDVGGKGSDVGGKGSGRTTCGSSSLIGATTFFVVLAMTK